jgi:hypothetical protein
MNPDANPAQTPQNPSGDNGSPGSSSSGSGGTPAGSQPSQEASALEVQRRERGRQEALQQRIDALTAQNQHLSSQLGGIVTKISADEEREWEAQLARMEPADRAAAIATRAMEENRALRRQIQQGRSAGPAVDPVAYKERKSREMVEAANQRHGLTGDAAMKVDDFDEEDLVDEKTFNTALRVEARLRAQGGAVPRKKDSEDDVVNRRVQEELRKHGVAAPASAKPTSSSGSSAVSEEDVQATLRNTRGSPRDKVAALRALEIKVDRPGRR